MDKKPNIFWFVADQMRMDSMAHMGNPASKTPNLDALKEEGVSFSHAYCQNPVCVPSRCSFLTGLYPHTTGHRTMHYMMRPDEPNILKTMKDNGYEVVWIGRNDVLPGGVSKENYCDYYFDGVELKNNVSDANGSMKKAMALMAGVKPEIVPVMEKVETKYSFYTGKYKEHSLDDTFDWNCIKSAINYLENRKENDKPFFIYCTLMFPHPPYGCEEPWYSLIDREKLPPRRPDIETLSGKSKMLESIRQRQEMAGWGEEQYDEIRAVYLGMVARFDHQLGMVIDKLKETGVYDDTNLFVFSDHGDYTGDYGISEKCQNSFEDTLTNVPLIVKPSSDIKVKSGINASLVELVDLPATVCDMAGADIGYTQFGKSLIPTMKSGEAHKDAVFCEGGRLPDEWQAMEYEHKKESPYWPRISVQHEAGTAHYKGCMIRDERYKFILRLNGENELYDLEKDPMEIHNIVEKDEKTVSRMKERMLKYFLETSDYVPPVMNKR